MNFSHSKFNHSTKIALRGEIVSGFVPVLCTRPNCAEKSEIFERYAPPNWRVRFSSPPPCDRRKMWRNLGEPRAKRKPTTTSELLIGLTQSRVARA